MDLHMLACRRRCNGSGDIRLQHCKRNTLMQRLSARNHTYTLPYYVMQGLLLEKGYLKLHVQMSVPSTSFVCLSMSICRPAHAVHVLHIQSKAQNMPAPLLSFHGLWDHSFGTAHAFSATA